MRKEHNSLTPDQKIAIAVLYQRYPNLDPYYVGMVCGVSAGTVRTARDTVFDAVGHDHKANKQAAQEEMVV